MSTTLQRLQMGRPLVARAALDQTPIPENFVGQFVAPDFQVDSFKFDFPKFGQEWMEAEDDDAVGNKGEFKETKIFEGTDSASLFERGRKAMVSRAELQAAQIAERMASQNGGNANAVFDLKVRIASVLRGQVLRRSEYLILKKLASSGMYKASHVAGGVGSPIAGPVNVRTDTTLREKFMLAGQHIADATGFPPNTAVVGRGARFGLDLNPAVTSSLPDNAAKFVTPEFLVQFIGLENVYYASAMSKRNAKAKAIPIFDQFIWIGYVDPTVNGGGPTFMRNFWMPYQDGQRAQATELAIGVEGNVWLSYAQMENAEVVGQDYGFLIPTTSAEA